MKFMFASDIHGSAYYCRKLMEAMEKEQPEKLLLLGDLLYQNPDRSVRELMGSDAFTCTKSQAVSDETDPNYAEFTI